MKKLLSLAAIAIAVISMVFVIFAQAQDQDESTIQEIKQPWELVTLSEPLRGSGLNYSSLDASPVISGLLYNKEDGPASGVFALAVTATCTSTRDVRGVTYCAGYQWSTEVLPFTFD